MEGEKKHWVDYATMIFTSIAAIGAAGGAIAAAWQVYLANDAEKKALRAFVEAYWNEGNSNVQLDPTKTLWFHFDIRNRGDTPAYNLVGVEHGDIYHYPLPKDFDFKVDQTRGKPSTVMPHNESPEQINHNFFRPLTDQERKMISPPSDMRFVMYGDVRYGDIFGIGHHTTFCQSYRLSQDGKPLIERCLTHNDAD